MKNKEPTFPLSFAQQRLWFLDQMVPGNPFYNISSAIPMKMPIKEAVLEKSLNEIIRRHESLRTTFKLYNGEPVQVVHAYKEQKLPVIELLDLTERERTLEVQRLATQEARRPFDLQTGPLIRTTLVKLDKQNYVFLLTIHHILSDGWSMGIFWKELVELYSAFYMGRASPLPELKIQYADFAVWQRNWLKGKELASQLEYWKKQLAGLPTLNLPTDHARPAITSYRGALFNVVINKSLTLALKNLSKQQGVTLFMTLMTVFKVLLYRYTGQSDLVVGSAIANRNRAEIEELIGFFVNSLVFRTNFSGDPNFLNALQRVREVAIDAYAHQDLPFEKLVDELQPERDLSRNPLFQVTFQLVNPPTMKKQAAESSVPLLDVQRGTAIFDIAFSLCETEDSLMGQFEYSTDLFEESTIARMAGHFENLLQAVVKDPRQNISQLNLLSESEKKQLLDWNNTASEYSTDDSVCKLFEAQVARTPDNVAVVFEDTVVTYSELNNRANQLANYLRRFDISPESLIGIYLNRSIDMVVAILGVLKSGCAYVPLEPAYPRKRIEFMLTDSQAPLLITQNDLLNTLNHLKANKICMDGDWNEVAKEPDTNITGIINAENIAYVIYTSGSTGLPKGTMINHRALTNHMLWMNTDFPVTCNDKILQKTPFSFDASIWEFYAPLLVGAPLIMAKPDGHKDTEYLVQTIIDFKITILQTVPTLLNLLLETPNISECKTLKRVYCGGEVLSKSLIQKFYSTIDAELINLYGPTEACIDSTYWICNKAWEKTFTPIGRPIMGSQMYVLDQHLNTVPVGIAGELYIGGVGLARGYINQPELTAKYFVPNLFDKSDGSRMYKTGDLVCYMPDGNLRYFGRIDQQIKLHGFRIELNEISSVLREHDGIAEAEVVVHEAVNGNQRLVAYVVQDPRYKGSSNGYLYKDLNSELISQWRQVYDEIYDKSMAQGDDTFDVVGWNSSYTGEPLAMSEMQEWRDQTVERILRLKPNRILEIGCGTGILLFQMAEHCHRYIGTDFNARVIEKLRHQIADNELYHVNVFERLANDLDDFKNQKFDVIILNSVIQYFPSVGYLVDVLTKAVNLISPAGAIFVGDVRYLGLLRAFHTSVQLHASPDDMPIAQLQKNVQTQIMQEKELLIDPEFFNALKSRLSKITGIDAQIKRGKHQNELSKFRYDVVIHVNKNLSASSEPQCMDWKGDELTVDGVVKFLHENDPDALIVNGVPNARVTKLLKTVDILNSETAPKTVKELRDIIQNDKDTGIDPEEFWQANKELPYKIDIRWSTSIDSYDVTFIRRSEQENLATVCSTNESAMAIKAWHYYASNPLRGIFAQELVPDIKAFLNSRLPDHMVPAAFILLESLPCLPNGKVNRRALPPPDATKPEVNSQYVPPGNSTEERLATIWAQMLGIERVGIRDNFFGLGGDSILSIQVVNRAKQVGLNLTPKQVFEHQTISELAKVVGTMPKVHAEQGVVSGDVPLTPIQAWFFSQNFSEPHHYNQAMLLEIHQKLDSNRLKEAILHIVSHHDALRLRFDCGENDWKQYHENSNSDDVFSRIALFEVPKQEQSAMIESKAAEFQASLNLSQGPLIRFILFDLADRNSSRLLVIIHHLVVDGVSWQILMEDFWAAYIQLSLQKSIKLPKKTTSFKYWAEKLNEYAQSKTCEQTLAYWLNLARNTSTQLPIDYEDGVNTIESVEIISVSLSAEETRSLLKEASKAYQTQVSDILLAALVHAYSDLTNSHSLFIDLEGHGRETLFKGVDVSRTVGWFTSIFPVQLKIDQEHNPENIIKSIKEQLRKIPNRGIDFGLLRYLSNNKEIRERLASLPSAEMSFNYMGQTGAKGSTVSQVVEDVGPTRGPNNIRRHLLEVNVGSVGGQLRVDFYYSKNTHNHATIEKFANKYMESLRGLIEHCNSQGAGGYTPSDFPKARMSQKDLDKLITKITKKK